MLPRFLLLSALAAPLLLVTATAQDAHPPDAETILRELDSIEQRREQAKNATRNAIISKIQTAANSGAGAANLYADAVEAVQFEGRKDRADASAEWRKKNAEALRARETQNLLQLYLRYVLLSMQRAQSDKPEAFVQPSLAYATTLMQSLQDLQGAPLEDARKMMNQPMADSVIAKWLRLGEWLPSDKGWELRAGEVGGILEKNVRGPLRAAKDPAILQVWETQMKFEAERVTAGRLSHQADEFNRITQPKLAFSRATDMMVVGQPNRAIGEMFVLVKNYPDHPDFGNWISTIREALKVSRETSP